MRSGRPACEIRRPVTTRLLQATASEPGVARVQIVRARIAGDLRPPLLHADGNLPGQAVLTLEWLQ
jgi:hypothetical protein